MRRVPNLKHGIADTLQIRDTRSVWPVGCWFEEARTLSRRLCSLKPFYLFVSKRFVHGT
jgi:hypothetical protein